MFLYYMLNIFMNMNVIRNFSLHNAEEILLKHKQYGFQYLHSCRTITCTLTMQ